MSNPEPAAVTAYKFARFLINMFSATGIVSIFYGVVSSATRQPWQVFEKFAVGASSLLTLAGCGLTAASVYFWSPVQTPPEAMSNFTAAIAIIACVLGGGFALRKPLPVTVLNGFAIVALAGSLLRLQPNPYLMPAH